MAQELIHHRLDRRSEDTMIEVWADDPRGEPPPERVVVLWFDGEVYAVDLTPAEARALAALLVLAAETQERAAKVST